MQCTYTHAQYMLMRDAERRKKRKKQARSNEQQDMYIHVNERRKKEASKVTQTIKQSKATQHTQDSHFSKEKCAALDVQTCNSGASYVWSSPPYYMAGAD